LKYIGNAFDQAAGLTLLFHPTLAELKCLFKSPAVQDILLQASNKKTGCQGHIDQVQWEKLAQSLQEKRTASAVELTPSFFKPLPSTPKKKLAPTKKQNVKKRSRAFQVESDDERVSNGYLSLDKGYRMHSPRKAKEDSIPKHLVKTALSC
jgi:hypothetical protein